MSRSILLASFVTKDQLYDAIDQVSKILDIPTSQIFIFKNEDVQEEYILTYNLNPEFANIKFSTIWPNTISIHRKKNTNSLYSLNAMNELIKSLNGGQVSSSFKVDWSRYTDTLLIIKNGRLKVIPIQLVKINR